MNASADTPPIDDVTDLFDQMLEETQAHDEVSMRMLLGTIDSRSYGPLLLLPGILAVSPVGAIPGMSVVTGSLIVLIAGQALWGRRYPWLPQRLLAFSFSRGKLERGVEEARPWARRVEWVIRRRLGFMHSDVAFRFGAAVCVILAATFYPLALVPMAVALPGSAVILFALGWTARDGILVLLAFGVAALSLGLSIAWWPG